MMWIRYSLWILFLSLYFARPSGAEETANPDASPSGDSDPSLPDAVKAPYANYKPDFIDKVVPNNRAREYGPYMENMKLSSEKSFFTLSLVEEDSRANALVDAALKKEEEGQYPEALKMYQIVIDKYPASLFRVSDYGVFIPISDYCQRRILRFPDGDLAFYRIRNDARAKEAFEQARRKHSLLGLAEVYGQMLATSYGGKAALELGNAALDKGHYLEALEYLTTVRDFFPDKQLRTPELDLKINYCEKMLGKKGTPVREDSPNGDNSNSLSAQQLGNFKAVVASAGYSKPAFHSQPTSYPNVSADDYTMFPPTNDPLALNPPVWTKPLPGSRRDFHVYTHPVVTERSIIYRHKNIIYSRSILNGELRWMNDLGGRVVWQDWHARQYPQDNLLVQDGLVFTPIYKIGESLVALDEVTGQMRWAYGPMVASSEEEANLRFGSAPTGGPRTIFASYIQDNVEGQTHIDSEYGIIAFESTTGRVRWKSSLCRLRPGKFAGAFRQRRNRIRSFSSPPLYHQGTVYHTTNAGTVAAVDALSGRVKWLMRYPYLDQVHDATREYNRLEQIYGGTEWVRPHYGMFWLNQPPLLVGETLYVVPVDSNFLYAIHRRTGATKWTKAKLTEGFNHLMGPIDTGELVIVGNGRNGKLFGSSSPSGHPVHLLNPETGETVWEAPDLILREEKPVMNHYIYDSPAWYGINTRWFEIAARPFLSRDGKLNMSYFTDVSVWWRPGCQVFHQTELDLKQRTITAQRRYYTGALLTHCHYAINEAAPKDLETFEKLPQKDDGINHRIQVMKEIIADTVPVNKHGPLMPFSRVTFSRYGEPFELRVGARNIEMTYDRAAVQNALKGKSDPDSIFANAELTFADARYEDSAKFLRTCLDTISSEDLDYRAAINQQLFQVHRRLARAAIRAGRKEQEIENVIGMSRTGSTLSEEVETLFALSEAYERNGDLEQSARCLRSIIRTYGLHEYPIPSLLSAERERITQSSDAIFDRFKGLVGKSIYEKEVSTSLSLIKQGLPLYFSTLSPLQKTLTVRAGELAASRLFALKKQSQEFAGSMDVAALSALTQTDSEDERLQRLWEFPGTPAAQKVIDDLSTTLTQLSPANARMRRWHLADAARICRLNLTPEVEKAVHVIPGRPDPLVPSTSETQLKFEDEGGTAWLVLERRGNRQDHANLLFLGGRVRKRFDNKFIVTAVDLNDGKTLWQTPPFRLKGKGEEPGFFEAFMIGDQVVVHGLFDVIAFGIGDGKELWHYRAPFDFEIRHAEMNGDLLILAGEAETLALYLFSDSPAGEVAWQEKEDGDIYLPPYFHKDRLVSVRKLPFNVTVRYRSTGKLIGRLAVPDLSLHQNHPLFETGHEALSAAHEDNHLVLTDGWYYINIEIEKMRIVWKRYIDANDTTRNPAIRFALGGEYLAVVKEDFDVKTIYMLSSRTGEILWNTDPKVAETPRPMHSMMIVGEKLYGIAIHPGQGFYWKAMDCKTGKTEFQMEVKDYQAKPEVRLFPRPFGNFAIALIKDRQEFEIKTLNLQTGEVAYTLKKKGVGDFGEHGRVSATVQSQKVILLSKDELGIAK